MSVYVDFNVKYPPLVSYLKQTWIWSTDFVEVPNVKFHENPLTGSRVVEWKCSDGHTHMMEQPKKGREINGNGM